MIDYIMQHLWQLWAVVALICLILELTAGDFFIICFAIGAIPAAVVAALGAGTYYQIVVFAVVTLVSLFYVRPFAKRYLHKGEDKRISNADALLGRQGRVVEAIQAGGFGRVQIDGDIWKAVTKGAADIPEGTNVIVVDRASTIITVEIEK
ncbi:NfeD family protein [Prevotella sp. P6B1]|uniref:NfeD family protein n=1 Tax=Prevotella sp. P6B1 TaxID=1410613 RepID=UPI00051B4C27|nr:NfeD family protein [Prevotella sp. P6B1]